MIKTKYAKYKPHGAYLRLSNDTFIVDADDKSGVLKGIYLVDDPYGTNYLGNEQNMRINVWWKQRYVPEKAQRIPMNCWTGDVVLKARRIGSEDWLPMHTFLSDDARSLEYDDTGISILYQGDSENPGGFKGLSIEQRYQLSGDSFTMTISLRNVSHEALQIGELGLPLILNANYGIGDEKQGFNHRSVDSAKEVFERRVIGHHFVSGHSSYVYANRPNGIGPILLMVADSEDTAFEAIAGDYYQGDFVETEYMKATGPILYLYSESAAQKPWFNGHRSLTLAPEEGKSFSVRFMWVKGFEEIEDALYEAGNVSVKAVPGMVLPTDGSGKLQLRCRKPIHSIEAADGIALSPAGSMGDRHHYDVSLNSPGEQKVTVRYGAGEWTNLLFYGLAPLESLIKARARFIAEKQQVLDSDDVCRYGFRTWNNDEDEMITPDNSPCGIIDLGGGDDRCNAPPMYLAEKNVYYPEPEEIKAMDDFVENFLYGKLQHRDSFLVRNCLYDSYQTYELLKGTRGFRTIAPFVITDKNGRETTWRSWDTVTRFYNYPYAYNVYFNMYRIAKLHNGNVSRPAEEYLYFAYRTALTSYADSTYDPIVPMKNYLDYHGGNMSKTHGAMTSWNVMNILTTLKEEGMEEEYSTLKDAIEGSWSFFLEEEYPYPTEYCFDMPSYAPVYYIGKSAGSEKLMGNAAKVIHAARHNVPLWFFFGSDLKTAGNYTTPQGARPLLDTYEKTGDEYSLRIGYGASLLVWSCVDPSGKGFHTREWRFNAPDRDSADYNYYWNEWMSGELGMGLYANLYALKSYLVIDSDFGLIGYGCNVDEDEEAYSIEPWDGLGVRASFGPIGIEIETVKGRIKRIRADKSLESLSIVLTKPYDAADVAGINVSGLVAGRYSVTGLEKTIRTTDDGSLKFYIPFDHGELKLEVKKV